MQFRSIPLLVCALLAPQCVGPDPALETAAEELGEPRRVASFHNPYGANQDAGIVAQGADPAAARTMRDAGVGWVRYWVSWHVLETDPSVNGTYNWPFLDNDLQQFFDQGLNVYITVIGGPRWAHGDANPDCAIGRDENRSCAYWPFYCHDPNPADPVNPFPNPYKLGCRYSRDGLGPTRFATEYFTRFVRQLVGRYKDRIKVWGFANEPAGSPFPPNQQQLAEWILAPAYAAVKEVDPSALVVGTDEYDPGTLDYMLGVVEPAYGRLFDVISIHSYGNYEQALDQFEQIIKNRTVDDPRPVWLTEYPMDCSASTTRRAARRGWIAKEFVFNIADVMGRDPCLLPALRSAIAQNPPPLHIADASGNGAGEHDFLLIQNPNAFATSATVELHGPGGTAGSYQVALPPNSRTTEYVPAHVNGSVAAVTVRPNEPHLPLFAEQAAYSFDWNAGRGTEASTTRSSTWYFAEGAQNGFWTERISVLNTGDEPVVATAEFMHPGGGGPQSSATIPARGVWELWTRDVPGLAGEHSTRVTAVYQGTSIGAPIAAERTMSWSAGAETHSSSGVAFPSRRWFFAEGSNSDFLTTFLLLQNPTDQTVSATVRYLMAGNPSRELSLPPRSRTTVQPPRGDFGMAVTATRPVVAERTMYGGAGWTIGTAGVGADLLHRRWSLPEGTTQGTDETYILIANPSAEAASVRVRFHRPSGAPFDHGPITVPAGARHTIPVRSVLGGDQVFSTEVESSQPIVVERSVYFNGWRGGHVSLGTQ